MTTADFTWDAFEDEVNGQEVYGVALYDPTFTRHDRDLLFSTESGRSWFFHLLDGTVGIIPEADTSLIAWSASYKVPESPAPEPRIDTSEMNSLFRCLS